MFLATGGNFILKRNSYRLTTRWLKLSVGF